MKRTFLLLIIAAFALSCRVSTAGETNAAGVRIGIYDSRLVAYAWFWSEPAQQKKTAMLDAVAAAKKAGDEKKLAEARKALGNAQADNHRQVFSIAPVDDVLATVRDQLAGVREKADVIVLVSKWDEAALRKYPDAEKIDVTDPLVRLFLPQPSEKQLKVIEQIRKSVPVPPEKADELIRDGKL